MRLTVAAPARPAALHGGEGLGRNGRDQPDRCACDAGFHRGHHPAHAGQATTLGDRPGDRVNLEADVLAKYVERLVGGATD